jgi:hypothetical protein
VRALDKAGNVNNVEESRDAAEFLSFTNPKFRQSSDLAGCQCSQSQS